MHTNYGHAVIWYISTDSFVTIYSNELRKIDSALSRLYHTGHNLIEVGLDERPDTQSSDDPKVKNIFLYS